LVSSLNTAGSAGPLGGSALPLGAPEELADFIWQTHVITRIRISLLRPPLLLLGLGMPGIWKDRQWVRMRQASSAGRSAAARYAEDEFGDAPLQGWIPWERYHGRRANVMQPRSAWHAPTFSTPLSNQKAWGFQRELCPSGHRQPTHRRELLSCCRSIPHKRERRGFYTPEPSRGCRHGL